MVFHGDEQFEIKRSKIRGQLSEGMICAEDELGIGTDHEGIIVLDSSATGWHAGSRVFRGYNSDTVFEIGLTPNMIDCSSHYGVARALAAYYNLQKPVRAKLPEITGLKKERDSGVISVTVEAPEACIRYSGLTVRHKGRSSPVWLQTRLRAIGLNPINNVVDITNFVLHETGQPLHAFDAAAIKGNRVRVMHLPEKTKFVTLDGVERNLAATDLMICNSDEGMCIAGVFGG
jgi:phenylalanyl-tRNA synthetase beta chain